MAEHTNARNATAFTVADEMEWNDWKALPGNQSRDMFLQEALDRAREEKIAPKAFEKFAADMPVAERRKSRGMELAGQLREKERGFDLEKPLGLWLAYTTQIPGPRLSAALPPPSASKPMSQPLPPPTKPLPKPPVQQRRPPIPKTTDMGPRPGHPLSRIPSASNTNNVPLSLFPKPRKNKMTPTSSARGSPTATPMRSRQNSVVKQADSMEKLRAAALKSARQGSIVEESKTQQLYTPRLSVCNETG